MAQLAMPITLGLRAPLQLSHAPRAAPARRRVLVRAAVAPEALEAASTLVYEAPSLTWQAAVGAVAGFFPFVIASIEFGKRIVSPEHGTSSSRRSLLTWIWD